MARAYRNLVDPAKKRVSVRTVASWMSCMRSILESVSAARSGGDPARAATLEASAALWDVWLEETFDAVPDAIARMELLAAIDDGRACPLPAFPGGPLVFAEGGLPVGLEAWLRAWRRAFSLVRE
ncbi:hypothetical protein TSO5_15770 [Azospirillum sp. TSO5]|nr:hypothetical protein TSO5_15770 [Azospirillum sp. TSO5]